ncbi:MAG: hypothetical protein ACMG57_04190 [Candidatus Dojkabacteria bacterium]
MLLDHLHDTDVTFVKIISELSNLDLKTITPETLITIKENVETIFKSLNVSEKAMLTELLFKIQLEIISNSNSLTKLKEYLSEFVTNIVNSNIKITSDQFEWIINAIQKINQNTENLIIETSPELAALIGEQSTIDTTNKELRDVLSIAMSLWHNDEIFPPNEKLILVKKKAKVHEDKSRNRSSIEIAESILSTEVIENGTLYATCIAGMLRSKSFINLIYNNPNHSSKLKDGHKSYAPVRDTLDQLKTPAVNNKDTLVVFTDLDGSDLLILIKGVIGYLSRNIVTGVQAVEMLNVMRGDLSALGISQLIIAEKNIPHFVES